MITFPGSVVAFCGRRFGKTDGYVQRLFYWMQRKPGLYWWVGLSWRSASLKRAWREATGIARQVYEFLSQGKVTTSLEPMPVVERETVGPPPSYGP